MHISFLILIKSLGNFSDTSRSLVCSLSDTPLHRKRMGLRTKGQWNNKEYVNEVGHIIQGVSMKILKVSTCFFKVCCLLVCLIYIHQILLHQYLYIVSYVSVKDNLILTTSARMNSKLMLLRRPFASAYMCGFFSTFLEYNTSHYCILCAPS